MDLFLQDVSGEGVYSITTGGYILFIALMVAALLAVSYLVNRDGKGRISIRQLTTSALCIALACPDDDNRFCNIDENILKSFQYNNRS